MRLVALATIVICVGATVSAQIASEGWSAAERHAGYVVASDSTVNADAVDQAAWEFAQELDTPEAYQAYLDAFPAGQFRTEAMEKLGIEPEPVETATPEPQPEPETAAPTLALVTPLAAPCEVCPRMVRIPGGETILGSDRGGAEGPRTPQTIPTFSMSAAEITVGDMRAFEEATGNRTGRSCFVWTETGRLRSRDGAYWGAPGFDVTDAHPAACVNWDDAQAYVNWLNTQDARGGWRLPSEAEFEYAVRAGKDTDYPWPGGADALCRRANGAGAESRFRHKNTACDDGTELPVPAGTFPNNPFGLSHMIGNLWEWTADCWNGSHRGAPADGAARLDGTCSSRVLRGGSWDDPPENLRSAYRVGIPKTRRQANVGFRVARDVE